MPLENLEKCPLMIFVSTQNIVILCISMLILFLFDFSNRNDKLYLFVIKNDLKTFKLVIGINKILLNIKM